MQLDQAVLQALDALLDERLVEAAVARALTELRAKQETQLERRATIERELALLAAWERHLVEAIKRGQAVEPLVAALDAEEARKARLTHELDGLADLAKVMSLDAVRLERDLKMRVADVRGLLGRHIPQARQMLRKLLGDRLTLTPIGAEGQRGYRFEGTETYGRLLAGKAGASSEAPDLATSHGVPSGIRHLLEGGSAWGRAGRAPMNTTSAGKPRHLPRASIHLGVRRFKGLCGREGSGLSRNRPQDSS